MFEQKIPGGGSLRLSLNDLCSGSLPQGEGIILKKGAGRESMGNPKSMGNLQFYASCKRRRTGAHAFTCFFRASGLKSGYAKSAKKWLRCGFLPVFFIFGSIGRSHFLAIW